MTLGESLVLGLIFSICAMKGEKGESKISVSFFCFKAEGLYFFFYVYL